METKDAIMETIADLESKLAQSTGFNECRHDLVMPHGGSHKYEIKTVTVGFLKDKEYKRIGKFYARSIKQIEFLIESDCTWMRKDDDDIYEGLKNGYHTTYYVERIY